MSEKTKSHWWNSRIIVRDFKNKNEEFLYVSSHARKIADWLPKNTPKVWLSTWNESQKFLCYGRRIICYMPKAKRMRQGLEQYSAVTAKDDFEYARVGLAIMELLDTSYKKRKKTTSFHKKMQNFTCYNKYWLPAKKAGILKNG